ncbi:hypothetical protein PRIPAC_76688 [Pristionchus pacificus]|uniref:Uncharacterized protein n=1 Tax=Pristionchus pacificus TaxID=54126 RepID=A0A2A6BEX4_PRIPA|nr:hypothetical protein PRIPAC_76688 [Pristionchus pacificus]|eukprot:PDM64432.1 hypothetical protein PRIPAC_52688 [Pristionchus pacificus]
MIAYSSSSMKMARNVIKRPVTTLNDVFPSTSTLQTTFTESRSDNEGRLSDTVASVKSFFSWEKATSHKQLRHPVMARELYHKISLPRKSRMRPLRRSTALTSSEGGDGYSISPQKLKSATSEEIATVLNPSLHPLPIEIYEEWNNTVVEEVMLPFAHQWEIALIFIFI